MPPAYEILLLNTAIPQIQAAQSGDTYVVPRDIAFSTVASFAAGSEATPSIVATGDANTGIWFPAADTVAISTGGISRLRLDSSGNLGLGVTPSLWASGNRFLDVNASASYGAFGSTDAMMLANAFWNGSNWIRKNENNAFRFVMESVNSAPTMNWQVAANGAAGSIISFTQAMTLDASGNLLVGETARAYLSRFTLSYDPASTNGPIFLDNRAFGIDRGGSLWLGGRYNSSNDYRPYGGITARKENATDGNSAGYLTFQTNGNATEPTERARITSGGNLLVGATDNILASNRKLQVEGAAGATLVATGTGGEPCAELWQKATSGDNKFLDFFTETSITARGSITYNRTAGLVAYNTTSDYRAKDILGPVANSGATIDALKVYEGKMKGATQSRPMLVAHEAQEVAPYAVTGEKDAVNEDGTPKYQQMDVSSLVPLLLAEIQSLRARVAQLEAK